MDFHSIDSRDAGRGKVAGPHAPPLALKFDAKVAAFVNVYVLISWDGRACPSHPAGIAIMGVDVTLSRPPCKTMST
jgi:hypothetical protein